MEEQNKDGQLFKKLMRLQWLMHRYHQQKHREYGPMGNPHRGQGRILTLLKLQPEISQKNLGYLLDMRPQSLGELLMKLERSGYITRTPSEEDRRVLNIRLTEAGEEAAKQAGKEPDPAGLFDCLSEEEQETFAALLERIIASLEQQVGDGQEEGEGEHAWRGPCGHHGPFDPRMVPPHGRPPFGWNGGPEHPFGHDPRCGRHGRRPHGDEQDGDEQEQND